MTSQLLYRECINSQFLSSLHFSHIMNASNLSFSKSFFFMTNSLCDRTCSRRDSTYPWWAFFQSNRWAWACCWSSLMKLLRDSTLCSCFISSALDWVSKWSLFPSGTDFATFPGLASLKTESFPLKTSAGCSLSEKVVLSHSFLMWEPCHRFPCAEKIQSLRRTWHQTFSSRVINFVILPHLLLAPPCTVVKPAEHEFVRHPGLTLEAFQGVTIMTGCMARRTCSVTIV